MKRDMELVRRILFAVELDDYENDHKYSKAWFDDIDEYEFYYHVKIMGERKLIKYIRFPQGDGLPDRCFPEELTWEGHEFLDSIRNESVWVSLKEKLGKELSTLPLTVLVAVSAEAAKEWAFKKLGFK